MAEESQRQRRWRESIEALKRNREAVIPCPNCELANLTTKDSSSYRLPGQRLQIFVDRFVSCPKCGARRVMEGLKL